MVKDEPNHTDYPQLVGKCRIAFKFLRHPRSFLNWQTSVLCLSLPEVQQGKLCRALLAQQKVLFEQWYRVWDGTLSWNEDITIVATIQQQVYTLLSKGAGHEIRAQQKTPLAKMVRTCQELHKVEVTLWTSGITKCIKLTNTAAARTMCPIVLFG
ncbi:MAG: hypothetical protein KME25_32275 [Symplocastrum torsivum CPER-KK1]|jgi:hypothetical protein|uniref:Transposase n=1 Tax=Symplocastrum torsivum CPER-KK1 TaxID=450513 RepID=A0A951UEQ8_9CYAN|nr:hypothetical protein [Symplocastrum torsivum CPER-KK1]